MFGARQGTGNRRSVRRLLLLLLLVSFFLAVAAYLASGLSRDASVKPAALINRPVPQFVLPPLFEDEPELSSADLRGTVSVVNVFASWCVPCRVEHPIITRLATELDVAVYGINVRDKPEDAKGWLAQLGNPYRRIGVDRNGRVSADWGVYGIPQTFIVDRDGRIRLKHVGPISERDLVEKVVPAIRSLTGAPGAAGVR